MTDDTPHIMAPTVLIFSGLLGEPEGTPVESVIFTGSGGALLSRILD